MAEKKIEQGKETTAPDPTAGAQQPDAGAERTFTQAELEHVIADRLARERQKFADYDALKAQAAELDTLKAAQMSELEKAQKRAKAAEDTRDAALKQANARLVRAAFVAEAAKAGASHPEDAFALADLAAVSITDDGAVVGVAEAVKTLVDGGRLVMTARGAPALDGGAGSGERTEKVRPLSPEELAIARKLRITPEDYATRKATKGE